VTLLWARALYVTKHYDEAESALTQMLQDPQLDPAHRNSALLSLANLAITRNRYDAAQELLQQVEQHDPATPELHWALGILFQREGQLARAQSEYEREFQISGDPEARKQADLLARKNLGAATPALPDTPASHRAVP
jgi:tetratricopeptide (TPR) repeat protein